MNFLLSISPSINSRVGALAAGAKFKNKNKKKKVINNKRINNKDDEIADDDIGFNPTHSLVCLWMKLVADNKWFQGFIVIIIFMASGLVGIQTYPVADEDLYTLALLDEIVTGIFVSEILIKLIAEGKRIWRFFQDGWNVFDFFVVVAGFLPIGGADAVDTLRLVRLLRVLKLVRALPKLRILVMGLLKSLSSIAYIGILLLLLFYFFAVMGVTFFGKNDPIHMGDLHTAMLTLFRCSTLEDWTDVMYIAMYGCAGYGYDGNEDLCTDSEANYVFAIGYFVIFVILSSMMILNLFIGVITSSMQDAKTDLSAEMEAEESNNNEDIDAIMGRRLRELSTMMNLITDEIEQFAAVERDRKASKRITLSTRDIFKNKVVTTDDHGKVEPITDDVESKSMEV